MVQKIAIVGGGPGGLATAFGLTESPDWQQHYDITVYQLGWRLGGKGASGRNSDFQQRIEEHGLHVWMGFYENAFRIVQACYRELNRDPDSPLATWQDAFKQQPMITWTENLSGNWVDWSNKFPEYASIPGDGTPMPTLWEGICRVIRWMVQTVTEVDITDTGAADGGSVPVEMPTWIRSLIGEVEDAFARKQGGAITLSRPNEAVAPEVSLLFNAHKLAEASPSDPNMHQVRYHQAIIWLLSRFMEWITKALEGKLEEDNGIRRLWILLDLIGAEIKGILSDGILLHGFDSIDDWELSDWLRHHGASQRSVDSAVLRGIYDCIIAYKNGDPSQPTLAAGTGLRFIFRFAVFYKGSILWKMQAGMGDTFVAPLYQVLMKRGVKFRFFHRIKALTLSADKKSIETIRVGCQATLKEGQYDPLVNVNGLPCWPSEPLYDQLLEGQELKEQRIDLESPWSPWKDVNETILQQGVDFDFVVLATSLAPIEEICSELIETNPIWQAMVEHVQTIPSQAAQLWLIPDLATLGWQAGSTILTGYGQPLETWVDMSQVLRWEAWPTNAGPRDVSYFCGPLPDTPVPPPFSDYGFPQQQMDTVKQTVIEWLQQYIGHLWPQSVSDKGFNWELLLDPQNRRGLPRFDAQYWRANISPAERYVLSLPGTTRYRLKADESGYENLYLAGDWIRTGLNLGCAEAAVMGGLQASRAICGFPQEIAGEAD